MFLKRRTAAEETFEKIHEHTQNQLMADIEEILQFADSEPIDKKSINCGFVFGYRNAKELYKEAIDKVMAENRRLKEKNILLRCNNESLNEKLEKRLK